MLSPRTGRMFMETTSIPAVRTAAAIKVELVNAGATKILEEYANGAIIALAFSVPRDGTDLPFRLPIRSEPIFHVLQRRRRFSRSQKANIIRDREQAARVAWRQVYRWVQAQLALVDTGMAELAEVFFPYFSPAGRTLYELYAARHFKAHPPPQIACDARAAVDPDMPPIVTGRLECRA